MKFAMPYGKELEIRASKEIDDDVDSDEEIDGIVYNIYWNNNPLPINTKTRLQAYAIALGCQWGAFGVSRGTYGIIQEE